MNIREQMDDLANQYPGNADGLNAFRDGFRAALSIFANPSDELVERCARALCEHEGCDFNEVEDVPSHISWVNQARAVLAAAVGEG